MPELLTRSALELADLVRRREVSAVELTEAALAAAEAQANLGAFTFLAAEAARATASDVGRNDPRPFAGVPTAIKDNRAVAGWPLTFGSTLAGDFRPGIEHAFVTRLRRAGFTLVGKTALPEFGILPTTESTRFGATRNPHDPRRTPGGSSGGSAAAVAAGILPAAHGNDGGGSLRIPAACCGLVGLKSARGRVSGAPFSGDSFLVEDGMLCRTVADAAALLDVLAGPEPGDTTWATPPAAPFAEAAARTPGRLRIGVTTSPPIAAATLDPECERVYREAAARIADLGHEIEDFEPSWSGAELLPLFAAEFGVGIATNIVMAGQLSGRTEPGPEDMEPLSWLMWERARGLSAIESALLHGQLTAFTRGIVATLSPYDAVLTPALGQRPPEIGAMTGALPDPDDTFRRSGLFTPYTAIANATGLPAIALPWGLGPDGLPSAVQLTGRPEGEGPLLALAAQLEAVRPAPIVPSPAARVARP